MRSVPSISTYLTVVILLLLLLFYEDRSDVSTLVVVVESGDDHRMISRDKKPRAMPPPHTAAVHTLGGQNYTVVLIRQIVPVLFSFFARLMDCCFRAFHSFNRKSCADAGAKAFNK